MELKDKIKAVREKHRFTQQELADRIGTTRKSLSEWERGIYAPREKDESHFHGQLDELLQEGDS